MVTSSFAPRRPPTTPSPTTASAAQLLAGIADSGQSGSLKINNNLSDVQSPTTSRANLGMFFDASSLWGNPTTASGTATYVTVGTGLAFTGGALVITASGVTTGLVANSAITYAKVQAVTASSLLGNPTTASATVSEITLGNGLSFTGSTLKSTAITMQYPFIAGRLYSSPWNNDDNTTLSANVIWLTPFVVEDVNDGATFTTASVYVSTTVSSKSLELMIYRDNAGTPQGGALVVDIGTVSVTVSGVVTKTFSQTLTRGRYWLGMASDGGPTIRGTGAAPQVASYMLGFLHTTGDSPVNGYTASWTFSANAAPNPCPTSAALNGGTIPLLYLSF